MPRISVIVPVYNVEKYLNRCVDSILAQTFTDFEVLLIDDGSKDNSGKICDKYAEKDKRVKVIHKENGGVSAARNIGIENAQGEYIAFVDSDDYVDENYLSVLYDNIDGCELSICGVNYCENDSDKKNPQKNRGDFIVRLNSDYADLISELLFERRLNYVYAKLFIKKIIKENSLKFNERLNLGEDTVFVFDYLVFVKRIYVIGDSFYDYIRNKNESLSQRFYVDIYERFTFITDFIEEKLSVKGISDGIVGALNSRRLLSGLWAINSIEASDIAEKDKIEIIDGILNNPKYKTAYNYKTENNLNYDFDVISPQSGKKYLKAKKRRDKINRIKAAILKICPLFIKRLYRKRKND